MSTTEDGSGTGCFQAIYIERTATWMVRFPLLAATIAKISTELTDLEIYKNLENIYSPFLKY